MRNIHEKLLRIFFVAVNIDDSPLKTSPSEWHDNSRRIASAIVIGINTFGDFERDVTLTEDYYLTLGRELGRDAGYLMGRGAHLKSFIRVDRIAVLQSPVILTCEDFPAGLLSLKANEILHEFLGVYHR